MKKLALNKIALSLVLIGYASSSAWAIISATTTVAIQGQLPILKQVTDTANAKPHTVTFKTEKADGTPHQKGDALRVNDFVILEYVLSDSDLDAEGEKDNTGLSIQFFHRKDGTSAWVAFPSDSVSTELAKQPNTKSRVKFKVPEAASGHGYIGYKIKEKTQFGYPAGDLWYVVPDAFDGTIDDLGKGKPTDPGDGAGDITDPDKGGGGDIETPVVVCPEGSTKPECTVILPSVGHVGAIYFVENGVPDTSVDLSASGASKYPLVGGTYAAAVLDTENNNVDVTSKYTKYQWQLVGDNGAAVTPPESAGPDNSHAIKGATAQQYTIGLNSAFTEFKAGAQGFKLKVEIDQ